MTFSLCLLGAVFVIRALRIRTRRRREREPATGKQDRGSLLALTRRPGEG